MTSILGRLLLLVCLVTPSCGLQVTPNSGCAALCIDIPTSNLSDPDLSTTTGSQIVCNDAGYSDTSVGTKFVQCLDCLQNSTYSSDGESDLQWFLYNIRYSFDACNYGYDTSSTLLSTPCSASAVCDPMKTALEDGLKNPGISTQYSYCTADDNAFSGTQLVSCINCFRETSTATYFANFLTALQSGCSLKPEAGKLLDLDGTLFSSTQISVETSAAAATSTHSHKSLSIGAIVGVAVGSVAVIVAIIAVVFICIRKRRKQNYKQGMRSVADARHGDANITVPVYGGYIEPPSKSPPAYEDISIPGFPDGQGAYSKAAAPVYLGKENIRSVDQHYERRQAVARQQQDEHLQYQPQASLSAQSPPNWPLVAEEYVQRYSHTQYSPRSVISAQSATRQASTDNILSNMYHGKTSPPIQRPYPSPRDSIASKRSSSTTISSTVSDADPKASPRSIAMTSSGLPKENIGTLLRRASSAVRPKIHTRDLSSSRAGMHHDNRPRSPVEISGPMVAITGRFEEDEPRGRTLVGPGEHRHAFDQWGRGSSANKDRDGDPASPLSPDSPEQWPGVY